MTKSKPELMEILARLKGGDVDESWKSWHAYRILMEIENIKKQQKEDEFPDVSTSTRLFNRNI
jgi:hypothetical protein